MRNYEIMKKTRKEYLENYRKTYKNKRVSITLTEQEYKEFLKQANDENIKISTFVKNIALYSVQQKTFVPASILEELKTLSLLIRGIANNVNQAAHYSNTIKGLIDDNGLLEHLRQLDEGIKVHTENKINN